MECDGKFCKCCSSLTEEGRIAEVRRAFTNPIYRTNFSKPLSEIIKECGEKLVAIRRTLYDIQAAAPLWRSQAEDVSGLLTCGTAFLYHLVEDIEKWEGKGGKLP
jgi:hypothetical protein